MKRFIGLLFVLGICCIPGTAESFNKKLSEDEREQLSEGKVLIRNINYTSNMCLASDNEAATKLKAVMAKLRPSYLAEVIQVRPYAGNEHLPEQLQSLLMNIPEYKGIPYYSEHGDAYYDLYSDAVIVSDTAAVNGAPREVKADLTMEPFGVLHATIHLATSPDTVYYDSTNDNELWYFDRFKCVGPEKMKSVIILFRDGDNWVLYGAGGVNAFRIPFFDKRIETSFINRIKTFCSYIFEKI